MKSIEGTKKILDRLYNLRGTDSVILKDLEKESEKAELTKEKAEKEKKELESSIEKLAHDENILAEQGEKLQNILKTINQEDFSVLVSRLNLDFNPEDLNNKISKLLPSTIADVVSEKKESEVKLIEIDNEMNSAITKLEELNIRKDEALENQSKLNEYIELSLSGSSTLTRDAIATVLDKFKFSKEEQREAAKLLMFPEDGLYEYQERLTSGERLGKSISDVFHEAKESVDTEEENSFIREYKVPEFIEPTISPVQVVEAQNPVQLTEELKKEEVRNLLKVCGFNISDFKDQDIANILEHYDQDVIANNVEYINNYGINKGIFVDNVDLLYDPELKLKVDTLISIGKAPVDIYLNPSVLLKYNLEELNNAIAALKESGLNPAQVPLMAF